MCMRQRMPTLSAWNNQQHPKHTPFQHAHTPTNAHASHHPAFNLDEHILVEICLFNQTVSQQTMNLLHVCMHKQL